MSKTQTLPLRNLEFNRLNGSQLAFPSLTIQKCVGQL